LLANRVVAIVDDDVAVLESLRLLLETGGYNVAPYNSALAFLEDRRTDVAWLIADHRMPDMTGLDLAAQLRADGSDIAVVLITSSISPAIIARASDLGVEVLEKPPNESALRRFLDQRY
jgi:two-component system, LuxR family, response regulator FixJ